MSLLHTSPVRTAPAPAVLLLLGAVAYTAWVLETPLRTGLAPVHTYVSELAAQDQPYGTLFRTTDLVAGVLILAAAGCALPLLPRRRDALAGWAGLALFGAATAVDSRLPLSCAPVADAGCAAREQAGLVPLTHTAHAVSSALAVAGALLAMVFLTSAARRHGVWPALARTGPALVALELAATAWTLTSVAAFDAGRGTWALGLAQRAQLLLIAAWLVLFSWSLLRSRDDFGPCSGPRSGPRA